MAPVAAGLLRPRGSGPSTERGREGDRPGLAEAGGPTCVDRGPKWGPPDVEVGPPGVDVVAPGVDVGTPGSGQKRPGGRSGVTGQVDERMGWEGSHCAARSAVATVREAGAARAAGWQRQGRGSGGQELHVYCSPLRFGQQVAQS